MPYLWSSNTVKESGHVRLPRYCQRDRTGLVSVVPKVTVASLPKEIKDKTCQATALDVEKQKTGCISLMVPSAAP